MLLFTAASMFFISCQKENLSIGRENEDPGINSVNNENSVPFRGDYVTTHELLQGPAVQRISGTGHATHLGASTFVANATVNFNTPPPFAISGTAVFTAANGDQFFTSFTGLSIPTGNGNSRGIINHTITGGTGRFEDASGSFTGLATVTQGSPTNTVTINGSIEY